MYHDEMLSIGRIDNGFIIEIRVPYKEDTDGCCVPHSERCKKFAVGSAEEAAAKIAKVLPMLQDTYDAAEEFDRLFDEITKESEE